MAPAPIVLFAYNRPDHVARCLEALAANRGAADSALIAFADAPRSAADAAAVAAVRERLRAARGFRRCTLVERPVNFGLFRSVTDGLAQVAREHDHFIVLEDDLVTAPCFLDYMNDALAAYAGTTEVGSVHAYMYPIADLPDYFFVHGGDCWGWGTWADRWRLFEPDARALLRGLRARGQLAALEAVGGARLTNRARGRNHSWAILWHASLVQHGRLTLQPGRTFVRNIGLDASGTHSVATSIYDSPLRADYAGLPTLATRADAAAMRRMREFLEPRGVRQAVTRLYAGLLGRLV
jgi:hypothetical protein